MTTLWIYRRTPADIPYIWSNLHPEDDAVFAHLTLGHSAVYEEGIPALQAVARIHGIRVIEADPAQVTEKASLPAEEYWKKGLNKNLQSPKLVTESASIPPQPSTPLQAWPANLNPPLNTPSDASLVDRTN